MLGIRFWLRVRVLVCSELLLDNGLLVKKISNCCQLASAPTERRIHRMVPTPFSLILESSFPSFPQDVKPLEGKLSGTRGISPSSHSPPLAIPIAPWNWLQALLDGQRLASLHQSFGAVGYCPQAWQCGNAVPSFPTSLETF